MKRLLFYSFFLLSMISCDKDKYQFPNANVDIFLFPNNPEFNGLHVPENWAYVNGGVNGILIYHNAIEGFIAYDRACTNDPLNSWLTEQITILNFFQPHIKIIDFYERLGNSSHCNFIQCLELAQMIFDNNQIPNKARNDFRQNTNSFQMGLGNNHFSGQCCLIICSNSMGDLHMGLIERYPHEM